jgi:poly(3-hydroxybutyrate) depolymerase
LDEVLNKNIDDVGLLDKIIRQTITEFEIGNRNVFVSGTSMGGYMTYQYALTHGADIPLSGIIPIVGAHGRDIAGEGNVVKVPVCDFSSELDEEVPYYNGWYEMLIMDDPIFGKINAKVQVAKPKPDVIGFWVNKNGANPNPTVYTYPTSGPKNTTVTKYSYAATDGKNEVIHYKSDNTDHNYFFRKSNGDAMDYLEEIVSFIQAHASGSSGIESPSPEKLVRYSNPVRDVIRFSSSAGTVSIYDLTGKKILSEIIRSELMDVSSLKTGIYLIRIQSEGNIQTGKLIKQ